jgi:hypothetical protein
MLGTHWELDGNTVTTWWEHIENKKIKKIHNAHPSSPKKKLVVFAPCMLGKT